MENYEVVLEHHGVKGMKWGIRRYQNRDGSLTPRGKRRLGIGDGISGYLKKRKAEKVKKKAAEEKKKAEEDVETKKAEILKSRSPKAVYENANLFTDNELRNAKTRFDLEKQIKDLVPVEPDKVAKYVESTKKVSDVLKNTGEMYNNIARIYNAFLGDASGKPLPTIDYNNQVKRKTKEELDKDAATREKAAAEAKKARAEAAKISKEADDIDAANAKANRDADKTADDAASKTKAEKQASKEQAKSEKQTSKEQAKTEKRAEKESEPKAEKVDAYWMPKSETSSKSESSSSKKATTYWDAEWRDVTDSASTSSGQSYTSNSRLLSEGSSDLPATYTSAGQSYLDRLLGS